MRKVTEAVSSHPLLCLCWVVDGCKQIWRLVSHICQIICRGGRVDAGDQQRGGRVGGGGQEAGGQEWMGVNKSDGQPVTSATSSASNNCSFSAMHIEATRGLVLVALAEEKELLSVRAFLCQVWKCRFNLTTSKMRNLRGSALLIFAYFPTGDGNFSNINSQTWTVFQPRVTKLFWIGTSFNGKPRKEPILILFPPQLCTVRTVCSCAAYASGPVRWEWLTGQTDRQPLSSFASMNQNQNYLQLKSKVSASRD